MTVAVREALEKLTRTITWEIDQVASASARPLSEMAECLGPVSRMTDTAGREGNDRIIFEIRGKDEDGKLAVFSPNDVIYDVLKDRRGRRGISFPTKFSDKFDRATWILRAGEKFDQEFNHYWPVSRVATKEPDWERDPTPQPMPGADKAETRRGIIVSSHSSPEGFAVKVRVQGPPDLKRARPIPGYHVPDQLVYPTREIFLDGTEYGKLVAAKKHELEAAAETPESPVRLVSCSVAAPEGDAAESAAESIQVNGVRREVQAPTDLVFRAGDDTGSSIIGIAGRGDSEGNILPALRVFPVSSRGDSG